MKKILLVFGLTFFVILNTFHIYAYWKDTTQNTIITDENPIEILSQSVYNPDGKRLVPKGVILSENEVDEFRFTYEVFAQQGVKLDVEIEEILINGTPLLEIENLFVFQIEKQILSKESLTLKLYDFNQEGYFYQITVILSMNMPTMEQYERIAGQSMSFNVVFKSNYPYSLIN